MAPMVDITSISSAGGDKYLIAPIVLDGGLDVRGENGYVSLRRRHAMPQGINTVGIERITP